MLHVLKVILKFRRQLQDIHSVVFSIPAFLILPAAIPSSAASKSNLTKLPWDPINSARPPKTSTPAGIPRVGGDRGSLKKFYLIRQERSAYTGPSRTLKLSSKY